MTSVAKLCLTQITETPPKEFLLVLNLPILLIYLHISTEPDPLDRIVLRLICLLLTLALVNVSTSLAIFASVKLLTIHVLLINIHVLSIPPITCSTQL